MTNKVKVAGKTYTLPEDTRFCFFEATKTAAVLKEDPKSPIFNGHSLVDSVDLKGSGSDDKKSRDVEALLKRNGARPEPAI